MMKPQKENVEGMNFKYAIKSSIVSVIVIIYLNFIIHLFFILIIRPMYYITGKTNSSILDFISSSIEITIISSILIFIFNLFVCYYKKSMYNYIVDEDIFKCSVIVFKLWLRRDY